MLTKISTHRQSILFSFLLTGLISLIVILNGMLLALIFCVSLTLLSIGNWLFHLQHVFVGNIYIVSISYTLILLSIFFGITRYGERLVKFFLNTRELLPHEKELLLPLIPLLDISRPIILLVGGQGFHNLMAFGHNTIIISDSLLNDLLLNTSIFNENEISVLFMREIGLLHYKHNLILLALWYSNIPTMLSGKLLHCYYKIQHNLTHLLRRTMPKGLILISILWGIILLLLSPIIILQWVSNKFMNLTTLYIKQHATYTADRFVVSQGYMDVLIAILSNSEILYPTNLTSEFKQIFSPQISNTQRIKRITT